MGPQALTFAERADDAICRPGLADSSLLRAAVPAPSAKWKLGALKMEGEVPSTDLHGTAHEPAVMKSLQGSFTSAIAGGLAQPCIPSATKCPVASTQQSSVCGGATASGVGGSLILERSPLSLGSRVI